MARMGWVESPLQLVNAVEYAAATGDGVHLCLREGARQLGDTGRLLAPRLPRGVTMSGPWRHATLSPFATARRRLVGDANSGQVRAVATFAGAQDTVLVDDGSGMLSMARRLIEGRPLGRHAKNESRLHRALGAAAAVRLRTAAQEGRLTVFTAYSDTETMARLGTLGATVIHNDYAWLRGTSLVADAAVGSHVVVGSALVDDGYLDADAYAGWLRDLAAQGPVTYYPHRRERRDSLQRWAQVPGVAVQRPLLPIEVLLASAPGVRRVSTLPSSVVATLSTILDRSVELDVSAVPHHWLTSAADDSLRSLLEDVSARGRARAVA
ncbi:MAG: hypothetical protein ACK5IM_01695 [Demequina sp.]|uniref:hypothetical protein n=1 Tax=Demequina sp. TaxID=2050685 RepID=UPI003A858595